MSLAQGNNTPTRPRTEPGSPDPESYALTIRPVCPPGMVVELCSFPILSESGQDWSCYWYIRACKLVLPVLCGVSKVWWENCVD